jgi:hypothetical protein
MRAVLGDGVEKDISDEPLAHEPSGHIRERHDHRVDPAALDQPAKRLKVHERKAKG